MLNIGVIGYGYWGPNIVRNFNSIDDAKVVAVCDRSADVLKKVKKLYPAIETFSECEEITKSDAIDAVAVVTPVSTHYGLAKAALLNGKHVFVEKPFTVSSAEARELIDIAARRNLKIMVDHTFIFTGAVRKMKEIIDSGVLGSIYYYDSTRVNLGLFQHDVNVIWDLAPHDFSIMDYLIAEKPVSVVACGTSHVNGMEDIAYVTVHFQNSTIA
ncbi:MAG: Gfo/Idh/MocA family protein, partial [bacterium]